MTFSSLPVRMAVLLDSTGNANLIITRIVFPPRDGFAMTRSAPSLSRPLHHRLVNLAGQDPETVTVISGSVGFGMGEKFEKKGELGKVGALFANPAKHAHYVWTGD